MSVWCPLIVLSMVLVVQLEVMDTFSNKVKATIPIGNLNLLLLRHPSLNDLTFDRITEKTCNILSNSSNSNNSLLGLL